MLKKIKKILLTIIFNNLIRILENFISKEKNIWLFGMDQGGGNRFAGNSWYLYKYIKKNQKNIRPICITSSPFIREQLKRIDGENYKPNTFKSLFFSLKARVNICAYDMATDLTNFSKKGTFQVNIWHGMIIKKIGYASEMLVKREKNKSIISKLKKLLIRDLKFNEYDFIPCTSESMVKPMKDTFGTNKIFVTGQPRDDFFFESVSKNKILKKYGLQNIEDQKLVCYLPTHRDIRKTDESYFIFENKESILNGLLKNNIVILQKNHFTKINKRVINGNVYNLTDDIDTQELLYISDVLITDYSSCYFDYLHTQRPIIFYPYDFDDYIKYDRELYLDYYDDLITPGIKVHNEDELYSSLKKYIKDPSLNEKQRKESLFYFQKFSDGRSSERNYNSIYNLINS